MTRLLPLLAIMGLFLVAVPVAHAQATTPTVSTVAVTSDPGTDDTYALGENIDGTLTFSEAVTVTGTPYLLIDVGGTNRRASYHSGSATTQLLFRYTVLAGDDDDDGIAVVANSLTLDGGTIVATDDATGATLDHAALATTDHKVDIVVTLVSNFGQTEASLDATISATRHEVIEFTVGDSVSGYQLDSVVLDVKSHSSTLDVEVKLYPQNRGLHSDISAELPLATFTGSVTTAGQQTFTMAPGPDGNLRPGASYSLAVVGSGSGTIVLNSVEGNSVDVGATDGWVLFNDPDFIEGADLPTEYEFFKVALRGHAGAIPFLTSASIYNKPHNGQSFAVGESIEVELIFSVATSLIDEAFLVPLRIGNEGSQIRGAHFVSSISCHRIRLSFLFPGRSYEPASVCIYSLAGRRGR